MSKIFNKKFKIIISILLLVLILLMTPYIILFSTYGLAENYVIKGNYSESEKTYKIGINIQKILPIVKDNEHLTSIMYYFAQNISGSKKSEKIRSKNISNSSNDLSIKKVIAEDIRLLSLIYVAKHNYKKAEDLINVAINLIKANERENYYFLASSYMSLAKMYSAKEFYENPHKTKDIKKWNLKIITIENYYFKAIKLTEKYKSKKSPMLNIYLSDLARFYSDIGLYDKAEPIYLRLIVQDKEYFKGYLSDLYYIYLIRKNKKKAENLLIRNIHTLEDQNFINKEIKNSYTAYYMADIYTNLSKIYKNKKDYKKFQYFKNIASYCYSK